MGSVVKIETYENHLVSDLEAYGQHYPCEEGEAAARLRQIGFKHVRTVQLEDRTISFWRKDGKWARGK